MVFVAHLLAPTENADPRDREHLLAHVLRKPREWVIAHPEASVRPASAARYRRLLRRLERGEPLPYLMGEAWFYGRPFTVNRHVLIPRPETELLIEIALRHVQGDPVSFFSPSCRGGARGGAASVRGEREGERGPLILDIGTGSGCIAVTLAAELTDRISNFKFQIVAIDSSPTALRIARTNARRNGVASRITFRHGNLLAPLLRSRSFTTHHSPFTILANLPYLTTAEWRTLPRSLRAYEPRQAFDGGPDGLKYFRTFFKQLKKITIHHLRPRRIRLGRTSFIILEVDPRRKRALTALIRKTLPGWRASWHRDLAGRWRIVELQGPTV